MILLDNANIGKRVHGNGITGKLVGWVYGEVRFVDGVSFPLVRVECGGEIWEIWGCDLNEVS